MHLLSIVTVFKINLNDVIKVRCFLSLQNVNSHNAFANDVKIKRPKCCIGVQRGRTATISFVVVKLFFVAISNSFSEGTLKVTSHTPLLNNRTVQNFDVLVVSVHFQ